MSVKSPSFVSLSFLSLSLSLSDSFSILSLFASLPFLLSFCFFLFLPSLPYPLNSTLFVCYNSFSHFFFSLFLHFLFSLLFWIAINCMVQKWGKLPPTFLLCHLSSPPFSLVFFFFLALLLPLVTWLNMSHSHNAPHGSCHVSIS